MAYTARNVMAEIETDDDVIDVLCEVRFSDDGDDITVIDVEVTDVIGDPGFEVTAEHERIVTAYVNRFREKLLLDAIAC